MPFLFDLYARSRAGELEAVPWDRAQKAAFLRMQFDAQHSHYQQHYPGGAFALVLVGDVPAGRLYVDRAPDELRIIDITIAESFRNQGIGTGLIQGLQREASGPAPGAAAASARPIRIHVEQTNPAQRLYARLGFRQIADRGPYLFLEWKA